jgi:predicted cupin superfamily sugar epimerase
MNTPLWSTWDAQAVIDRLGLIPHPEEGGHFRETYRAPETIAADPVRYQGSRSFSTAIYYLLTPQTFSHMHLLESDEIFHFYAGDPVEQLLLHPNGAAQTVILGPDLFAGQEPQHLVPARVWQGARLAPGGRWALLGCTVAPGFDFADYHHGTRQALAEGWPALNAPQQALLNLLTSA